MREIVGLFGQSDSRDELGIGQIRDALSDALFPGTSVLITRARYLLFVPWCFQKAAEVNRPGADARRDKHERDLISTLREGGDIDGLLGATAGRGLKTLPSATYWNSLRRWGVLEDTGATWQEALGETLQPLALGDADDASFATPWSSTMPAMPAQFPQQAPGGFALTPDEAQWLVGRILTSCDGTLLAHLAANRPAADSPFPWADPAALSASVEVRALLEHARVFSQLVHGAALLYNLLVAEAYANAGFDRLEDRSDHYRQALAEWEASRDASSHSLQQWGFPEFRAVIQERNSGVSPRTWAFLRSWAEIAAPGSQPLADSLIARQFIGDREREHKRSQSRLRNRGLLGSWSGAAGSGAIAFRWAAVRRILSDIHDGLDRNRA